MPTLTLRQGLNGYTGVRDTQIQQANPTSTYATNNRLMADLGIGVDKQSLLTFTDLFGASANQIPTGATITKATLALQTSNASAQGGSLNRMLIPWTDTSASWDLLGSGIQFDDQEAASTADVITGPTALGPLSLDVTSSLKAWQGGATNYGWVLKPGGNDSWEVYSSDGTSSLRPTLTVEYTLGGTANGLPVAVNDTASTNQGQAVAISVLANDTDPDQDPLSVSVATSPAHGTTVLGQNGIITYTPAANYSGADSFNYTISDGRGGTDTATVSVSVAAVSLPIISIQDGTPNPQIEGPGRQITFTLNLDKAPAQAVTVHYATANGSAAAGSDYVGITDSAITFSTGQTTATVTVTIQDDTIPEGTESFTLNLTSATNATIGKASGTGTIADNDSSVPPSINASVVKIYDTTKYNAGDPTGYGSGDPSGLAYVPGSNTLFIADSEHDESPYLSPTNLFAVRADGSYVGSYSLTSFSKEPTGLAYNPQNGYLYITDDDKKRVFWVNPDNPSVKVGSFDVGGLGIMDAEDPKFDPVTGNMYMLDGLSRTFFELTVTGQLVRKFVLPSVITDAEALAYDAAHDVFFIGSGKTGGNIFELDHAGNLLGTVTTLNSSAYKNPMSGSSPKIKGLEFALSSNPNDGNKLSLFAVDYGSDQKPDGRLFEIDLGAGWFTA